jgi:flagellar basal body-associated protein FliL
MKKKDISIIVVVAIVSAVISFFLSSVFISSASDRKQSVEVAPPIVAEFTEPDDRYFNQNSMNPTQTIVISPETNPNPFKN